MFPNRLRPLSKPIGHHVISSDAQQGANDTQKGLNERGVHNLLCLNDTPKCVISSKRNTPLRKNSRTDQPIMRAHKLNDMHPADIRAAVNKKGLTLTAVALAADLPEHACRAALKNRSIAGEAAIAKVLGVEPKAIWPSRFRQPRKRRLKPSSTPASPVSLCQKRTRDRT